MVKIRPSKTLGLLVLIFSLAIIVGVGVFLLSSKQLNKNKTPMVVSCHDLGADHLVQMVNSQVKPVHTNGKLCDRLTIVNKDNTIRLVAFGPHTHHVAYDGVTSEILDRGQSLTVVMNQVGNFQFHDHLNDSVRGTFSVTSN